MSGFAACEIAPGVHRIVDRLANHCYLVVGERSALLVDTAGGLGNLAAMVRGLTELPVSVALTHGHYDHLAGSYWFDQAYLSPLDGGAACWDVVEEHARRVHAQMIEEGLAMPDDAYGPRDGARPTELPIEAGDCFDLGGRSVEVVALPGHTAGSLGYLVSDCRVLLAGDAVTPVMCLFFAESLGIEAWRQTLAAMVDLPFDHFYTGHHDHAFAKADLASFDAAAAFALTDRGIEWQHARLEEFKGIMHLCPCDTFDVDSVDFRAVIEPWRERPARRRRSRRTH